MEDRLRRSIHQISTVYFCQPHEARTWLIFWKEGGCKWCLLGLECDCKDIGLTTMRLRHNSSDMIPDSLMVPPTDHMEWQLSSFHHDASPGSPPPAVNEIGADNAGDTSSQNVIQALYQPSWATGSMPVY